jgi:hypothetical protein
MQVHNNSKDYQKQALAIYSGHTPTSYRSGHEDSSPTLPVSLQTAE